MDSFEMNDGGLVQDLKRRIEKLEQYFNPPMKTLKAHNEAVFNQPTNPTPRARVACDKCGTEMVYNTNIVMTSDPPQRSVECPNCNYKSTKWGY